MYYLHVFTSGLILLPNLINKFHLLTLPLRIQSNFTLMQNFQNGNVFCILKYVNISLWCYYIAAVQAAAVAIYEVCCLLFI